MSVTDITAVDSFVPDIGIHMASILHWNYYEYYYYDHSC